MGENDHLQTLAWSSQSLCWQNAPQYLTLVLIKISHQIKLSLTALVSMKRCISCYLARPQPLQVSPPGLPQFQHCQYFIQNCFIRFNMKVGHVFSQVSNIHLPTLFGLIRCWSSSSCSSDLFHRRLLHLKDCQVRPSLRRVMSIFNINGFSILNRKIYGELEV